MNPKNAVYAAVGAPIVAARALNARLGSLREELESRTEGLSEKAHRALEEWTQEGRQAVEKVSDAKMVDEFAAKVDFDQAREQVGKLRDQLEDMLATWRSSFRPEAAGTGPVKPAGEAPKEEARAKAAPSKGNAATSPQKTTAARKPAAKSGQKSPSKATKAPAARKPAGQSDATETEETGAS